jgi:chromosome segregation ATPase
MTGSEPTEDDLADILQHRISALEGKQPDSKEEQKRWTKAVKRLTREVDVFVDDENITVDDKVRILHEKLVDSIKEGKKFERLSQITQRKLEYTERQKDTAEAELTKVTAVKSKLETLCKELQKQQRTLASENQRIVAEEQEKRKNLSNQFQETIADVKFKMEDQSQAHLEQAKENVELRAKLNDIVAKYEERDTILKEQSTRNDERMKLLDEQIQAQKGAYGGELERLIKENEALKAAKQLLEERNNEYNEKFTQFQETLTKSNSVFDTFKAELDRTQQALKKSEKDNAELRDKANESAKLCLDLANERVTLQEQISKATKKGEALAKLCKSLQAERAAGFAPPAREAVAEGSSEQHTAKDLPAKPDC